MTSHMFLRRIPTHFYLQCSEGQVSMTIPCHFVSVVRRISWVLNLVVGQVFVLWFIQREEAHRAVVVETDFAFRLNNKQIKQRKTNSSIRYWDQHIPAVLSLPHRWDLKPFPYFLSLSTHTFPQTLQPPHRHTDTHGHSGPGCSLCQHSATCTCHLLTKGKGEAARHPWPPQTHLSVGVSPWLTFREGAQLGSRIIGGCTAEIWPCFRNRHRLPNEFPTACSPRLPFLSVSHSSAPHVLFSCNSMCFILLHHKEDV